MVSDMQAKEEDGEMNNLQIDVSVRWVFHVVFYNNRYGLSHIIVSTLSSCYHKTEEAIQYL